MVFHPYGPSRLTVLLVRKVLRRGVSTTPPFVALWGKAQCSPPLPPFHSRLPVARTGAFSRRHQHRHVATEGCIGAEQQLLDNAQSLVVAEFDQTEDQQQILSDDEEETVVYEGGSARGTIATIVISLGDSAQLYINVLKSSRGRFLNLTKHYASHKVEVRIFLQMEMARKCVKKLADLRIPHNPACLQADRPIYSSQLRDGHRRLIIELLPRGDKEDGGGSDCDGVDLSITTIDDTSGGCKQLRLDAKYLQRLIQGLSAHLRDYADDVLRGLALQRRMLIAENARIWLEPGDTSLNIYQTSRFKSGSLMRGSVHVPYSVLPRFIKDARTYAAKANCSAAESPQPQQQQKEESSSITLNRRSIDFQPQESVLKIIDSYCSETNECKTYRNSLWVPWPAMKEFVEALESTLRNYEEVKKSEKNSVNIATTTAAVVGAGEEAVGELEAEKKVEMSSLQQGPRVPHHQQHPHASSSRREEEEGERNSRSNDRSRSAWNSSSSSLATITIYHGDGERLFVDVMESSRGPYIKLKTDRRGPSDGPISLPMESARWCARKLRELMEKDADILGDDQTIHSAETRNGHKHILIQLSRRDEDHKQHHGMELSIATFDKSTNRRKVLAADAGTMLSLQQALESHLLDYGGDESLASSLNTRTVGDENMRIRLEPGDKALKIFESTRYKTKGIISGSIHVPYSSLGQFAKIITSYAEAGYDNAAAAERREAWSISLDGTHTDFYAEKNELRIVETIHFESQLRSEFRSSIWIPWTAMEDFAQALAGAVRDYEGAVGTLESEKREVGGG